MSRILLGILMLVCVLIVVSRLGQGGAVAPAAAPVESITSSATEAPAPAPMREPVRRSPVVPAPPAELADASPSPGPTPTIDRLARLESRRRLFQSARHTFVDSLFTTPDSVVRRWVPAPGQPLRVAVVLPDSFAIHRDRTRRALGTALGRWAALRLGISFTMVRDTSAAEIVVGWIDRFDDERSGLADIQYDADGVIHAARITLALRMADGRPLGEEQLRIVATHEVGHALGLPHSDRPTDVMFPTAALDGLSPRDRATASLIYAVSPGSMTEPILR